MIRSKITNDLNDHTWSDAKDELEYKKLSWYDIFNNLKK